MTKALLLGVTVTWWLGLLQSMLLLQTVRCFEMRLRRQPVVVPVDLW